MKRTLLICSLAFLIASTAGAQIRNVDLQKEKTEILTHYRSLVQIDTSSPPGNETKAVEYLRNALEAEGIATKTFALVPERANLVARLKGNGSKRAICSWLTRTLSRCSGRSGRSILLAR